MTPVARGAGSQDKPDRADRATETGKGKTKPK